MVLQTQPKLAARHGYSDWVTFELHTNGVIWLDSLSLSRLTTTGSSTKPSHPSALKSDDVQLNQSATSHRVTLGKPMLVGRSSASDPHFWFPSSGASLGGHLILPVRTTCDTPCFNASDDPRNLLMWQPSPIANSSLWKVAEAFDGQSDNTEPVVDWFSGTYTDRDNTGRASGVTTVQPHRAPASGTATTLFPGHATRWELNGSSLQMATVHANVSFRVPWRNISSLDGCGYGCCWSCRVLIVGRPHLMVGRCRCVSHGPAPGRCQRDRPGSHG